MKLPRWLVIAMLTSSVLAVLAAAGWWWVTWPERTAREFVELVNAGKSKEAREMIFIRDEDWDGFGHGLGPRKGDYYPGWLVYLPTRPLNPTAQPREVAELMRGEQEFLIGRRFIMRIERDRIVTAEMLP